MKFIKMLRFGVETVQHIYEIIKLLIPKHFRIVHLKTIWQKRRVQAWQNNVCGSCTVLQDWGNNMMKKEWLSVQRECCENYGNSYWSSLKKCTCKSFVRLDSVGIKQNLFSYLLFCCIKIIFTSEKSENGFKILNVLGYLYKDSILFICDWVRVIIKYQFFVVVTYNFTDE